MRNDNSRFRTLLWLIGAVSQALVGLALLGIVPGANHTDGWFARFAGPVLLASAVFQLVALARGRGSRRDAG
ncbi:hypothetical protein FUT87_14910 [Mitsuaria sp. TWR114]|uniref:hypothetical protein n=1 Tax=unclassified Roseateles TaxID=2626991 RepID=UPI0008E45F2A|nr:MULTISPECIES: hypothetical protein [unclassified Roseateles]MBB3284341.1 hypothetical protein [Mitsuaria sp. BK037]TXD85871.1 hypothetical protein FUT87_14910 [Mitsuaria sp. TWR114]SFR70272.1 hypothetical protein SAMN05428960_0111 [Mitsuaria sp. PDC51]